MMIKQGRLCGNVVIGYLKKKGFPEVALQFVEDPSTRFTLALEFAHVEEALAAAEVIDAPGVWNRLAKEAMKQGNVGVAEQALKKAKDFEGLCFLYVLTGSMAKLAKLGKVAEARGDLHGRFTVAALTGDVAAKAKVLSDGGLIELVKLATVAPRLGSGMPEPHLNAGKNWELETTMQELFANQWVGVEQSATAQPDQSIESALPDDFLDAEEESEPEAHDDSAWGGGFAELTASLPKTETKFAGSSATIGESVEKKWLKQRRLPFDLVAAGEFDEALNVLVRRIDLLNPLPLSQLFNEVYVSTRCVVPGLPLSPSLVFPILSSGQDGAAPLAVFTVASLAARLKEAQKITSSGRFEEAANEFKNVMACLTLAVAESSEEEAQLRDFLDTAREYAAAMMVAVKRSSLSPSDIAKSLELASYMTTCKMQPSHLFLALRMALTANFKAGNFVTAAAFAQKLLTGTFGSAQTPEFIENTRGLLQACEDQGQDTVPLLEFDSSFDLDGKMQLCCGSLRRLGRTDAIARCSFCAATYNMSFKGNLCSVCNLSAIGGKVLGVQFRSV